MLKSKPQWWRLQGQSRRSKGGSVMEIFGPRSLSVLRDRLRTVPTTCCDSGRMQSFDNRETQTMRLAVMHCKCEGSFRQSEGTIEEKSTPIRGSRSWSSLVRVSADWRCTQVGSQNSEKDNSLTLCCCQVMLLGHYRSVSGPHIWSIGSDSVQNCIQNVK